MSDSFDKFEAPKMAKMLQEAVIRGILFIGQVMET